MHKFGQVEFNGAFWDIVDGSIEHSYDCEPRLSLKCIMSRRKRAADVLRGRCAEHFFIDEVSNTNFGIKSVVFNDPATIVIWEDGTKTVVKCQDFDAYDERMGLLYCIAKKAFGNKGKFNDVLNKYAPDNEVVVDKDFLEQFREELVSASAVFSDFARTGISGIVKSKEETCE